MWSSSENYFLGKTHGDTFGFDDGTLFSKYPGCARKIKELKVYHTSSNIVGLQATYHIFAHKKAVEGPCNVGKEIGSATCSVIKLEDNEYITEVFGRNGDIFDHIGFKTNMGRSWEFGGSGGNPFCLKAPYGKHFSGLRGGLGGHVHNINFYVDPLPWIGGFQTYTESTDEFFRGKRHGDTVQFDDESLLKAYGGLHKICKLRVWHDDKFVFGLQADYFVYGPNMVVTGGKHMGTTHLHPGVKESCVELESDEFLVGFFGRNGDIFDNLGFKTSKGRKFDFGGSGGDKFKSKAPFGKHFAVLRGGYGGHIHNLHLHIEPIFQMQASFKEAEFKRGKTHGDTVPFSDAACLKNYPPSSYKIWKITIFHDDKFIFGWKADYFVFGPNIVVEGQKHLGSHWKGGKEEVIELGPDEYITHIFGRNGDIMDNFGFSTNKGRKFDFGGSGGDPFEAHAPKGHHFGLLAGGLGGHVHNIDFHAVPMGFFGFGGFGLC